MLMRKCVGSVLAAVLAGGCICVSGCGAGSVDPGAHAPVAGVSGQMAFVSRQNSVNHIFLVNIDAAGAGSNPVRLTGDEEAENYPSWSPDGKRLVYTRAFNGSAIYTLNPDGSDLQQLTDNATNNGDPAWSPDGSVITFGSDREGGNQLNVFAMNADGSGATGTGVQCSDVGCAPRWRPL